MGLRTNIQDRARYNTQLYRTRDIIQETTVYPNKRIKTSILSKYYKASEHYNIRQHAKKKSHIQPCNSTLTVAM